MRPSYDAEHPSSPTPIYDELYSEYRRLFRALPGDRAGEEDLRFTGFATRDRHYTDRQHPERHYTDRQYSQERQLADRLYAVDTPDLYSNRDPYAARPSYGHDRPAALSPHQAFPTYAGQTPGVPQFVPAQQQAPQQHVQHPPVQAVQHPVAPQQQAVVPHPGNGQGWVAAGYLAPSGATATATAPTATATAGRHRSGLLSLPPGRSPEQS